jgi:5'-hydroxyaverantin dehydrogenase
MDDLFASGTPVDFTKALDKSVLNGRSALVTGGASGIGFGIVQALVENGAVVTIADRNKEAGKKAVRDFHGKCHFVDTDVTNWDSQVAAFESTASRSPNKTIDIIVTSAGIEGSLASLPPLQTSEKPVKPSTATLDVNLTGTYYSAMLALWYFGRSPPDPMKQLLFICSLAGYHSIISPTLEGDYEASKFGVRGLFHQLHPRSHTYGGARINMLCPTFVDTPLLQPGVLERVKAGGLKTAVVGDAVEGAMRCLCSDEVKGRSVVIAGGEASGGEVGSANFDMCDEVVHLFGGKGIMGNLGRLLSGDVPSL